MLNGREMSYTPDLGEIILDKLKTYNLNGDLEISNYCSVVYLLFFSPIRIGISVFFAASISRVSSVAMGMPFLIDRSR